jgi:2-C-methyl-D-erythritol 4-phosphate cytidylyltransferase/2-C-methyl-D-erythritol 2,4-cyclodiphosphate synthase
LAQVELAWAIVTAAGFGRRMGSDVPKQYLSLGGKPILVRTLQRLSSWPGLRGIVVTAPPDSVSETETLLREEGLSKVLRVVPGGKERQESVLLGLSALTEAGKEDIVFIHDGVRPFPPVDKFDELCAASRPEGALLALTATDTVKLCREGVVEATIDRSKVRLAQTPQAFPHSLILKAHQRAAKENLRATDDASLIESYGGRVRVVEGTRENIKITTPEDLRMAQSSLPAPRLSIGHGYDAHRLVEGRPLILGGVTFDHPLGLLGHSDADVVAHAAADACLGGAGLGDLGRHFPDSDMKWKGADSLKILQRVGELVRENGLLVQRVDVTVIAQKPKLAPYIAQMEENLSKALGLPEGGVTVKATTTEGMGFEGRQEGISAHAVALLS